MSTRDELHRLVNEQQLTDATSLLRTLKPGVVPRQPRRRLSLIGAYDSGRTDVATRSAEILRTSWVVVTRTVRDPRYRVLYASVDCWDDGTSPRR